MLENPRLFEAGPDPFGRTWQVRFRWHQTAISIRHADTVDVKYELTHGDETVEKVVAVPHPALLALAKKMGRPVTDPWVMRLAGAHILHMVSTFEDFEKTLVTLTPEQMEEYAAAIAPEVHH